LHEDQRRPVSSSHANRGGGSRGGSRGGVSHEVTQAVEVDESFLPEAPDSRKFPIPRHGAPDEEVCVCLKHMCGSSV
jgi:hypothetical protein